MSCSGVRLDKGALGSACRSSIDVSERFGNRCDCDGLMCTADRAPVTWGRRSERYLSNVSIAFVESPESRDKYNVKDHRFNILCTRSRVLVRMDAVSSSLTAACRMASAADLNLDRDGSGEVGLRITWVARLARRGEVDGPPKL